METKTVYTLTILKRKSTELIFQENYDKPQQAQARWGALTIAQIILRLRKTNIVLPDYRVAKRLIPVISNKY